jgi:hypothetical protein
VTRRAIAQQRATGPAAGLTTESVAATRQLVDALISLLQVGCDLSAAVFASSIDEPGIA